MTKEEKMWLGGIFGVFVLLIILSPNMYEFMGKRWAGSRHEVFKNSTPHIEGQISHLTQLKGEYILSTDDDHKQALKLVIMDAAAQVDRETLPKDLRTFIKQIEGGSNYAY